MDRNELGSFLFPHNTSGTNVPPSRCCSGSTACGSARRAIPISAILASIAGTACCGSSGKGSKPAVIPLASRTHAPLISRSANGAKAGFSNVVGTTTSRPPYTR